MAMLSLENHRFFNILADLMNVMNEKKTLRDKNKDYIEFLEDLINFLVFEIVFSKKFHLDGLNTNLINRESPYLINRKFNSIEHIQETIKEIQDDENIRIESKNIKNHPWVKIIDAYFKN